MDDAFRLEVARLKIRDLERERADLAYRLLKAEDETKRLRSRILADLTREAQRWEVADEATGEDEAAAEDPAP